MPIRLGNITRDSCSPLRVSPMFKTEDSHVDQSPTQWGDLEALSPPTRSTRGAYDPQRSSWKSLTSLSIIFALSTYPIWVLLANVQNQSQLLTHFLQSSTMCRTSDSCSLLRSSPMCKTTDSAAHFFEVRQCTKPQTQLLTSSKFANVQNHRLSCSPLRSSPRCKTEAEKMKQNSVNPTKPYPCFLL